MQERTLIAFRRNDRSVQVQVPLRLLPEADCVAVEARQGAGAGAGVDNSAIKGTSAPEAASMRTLSAPATLSGSAGWHEYDREGQWDATLQRLVTWVSTAGFGLRLPMRDARDREERTLANWVSKQRKQKVAPRGGWGDRHCDALEGHAWWSWASVRNPP